jgi:hypothetical protein
MFVITACIPLRMYMSQSSSSPLRPARITAASREGQFPGHCIGESDRTAPFWSHDASVLLILVGKPARPLLQDIFFQFCFGDNRVMSCCNSALIAPRVPHPKKRAFLAAFSRCGSISQAAKRAKVDRRTHYNWIREDSGYREAFQYATIEAGDALEDKLSEMAHDGNVTAAIFLLKGIRPEKYKDRRTIQLDLKEWDGDLSKLSDEQLEQFLVAIDRPYPLRRGS